MCSSGFDDRRYVFGVDIEVSDVFRQRKYVEILPTLTSHHCCEDASFAIALDYISHMDLTGLHTAFVDR